MACVDPGTLSPGYLRLDYIHNTQSIVHTTRARLLLGIDPLNFALMQSEADNWANVWKGVTPPQFGCGQFSVLRHDGSLLYSGSLSGFTVGAHGVGSGALDYASRTICFTGRGLAPTAAQCSGEAIGRVFIGAGLEFLPRQKYVSQGVDAGFDAYAAFLEASLVIWADEFGNNASVRARYPIQINAYAQGKNGT